LAQIQEFGGRIEVIQGADEHGNYLRARLDRVRELVRDKGYVWTNQYASAANARAHYAQTAPELWRQASESCDAVLVAVSTGGTLAGTSRYLREVADVRVVAVDVVGSVALGGPPGPRILTGIGSSRRSEFLSSSDYDEVIFVTTSAAVSHCRSLAAATGLHVGGSSGAVLAAAARFLLRNEDAELAVCLCPDGGDRYASTIYSDSWLEQAGVVIDGPVASCYQAAALGVARSGIDQRLALSSLRSCFLQSAPAASVVGA
jgi:cysteine synthase